MDLEHDLRNMSDDMLSTLEQLQNLEHKKRSAEPGTPGFTRLAKEIEKLAGIVFAQTTKQQSLAEQSAVASQNGVEIAPINEVTTARDVSVILSEWRDAERRLAATAIESAEHAKAAADVRRLRDEYHRTYKAQTNDGRAL